MRERPPGGGEMSPRPLYQAAVAELETVLSPRVVSRSLKEGMAQLGSTPEAIGLEELERILKGQIYRQLQVAMPLEKAKETISEIVERLRALETGTSPAHLTPAPLEGQQAALDELKQALRPFNLYFEWPEVQKLRAQLQLLESEQAAGHESAGLLRDAREQLRSVTQKLEDQLVIQARDLGELEGLLEQVRGLGGPKVRRLENLLGQIRSAQEERQLAPAEVDRSRKLAAELRKLLESSVLAQIEERREEGETGVIEVDGDEDQPAVVQDLDDTVNERLLRIELETDSHELSALAAANAHLLEHDPALRRRLDELSTRVAGGELIGDELGTLRVDLERAAGEIRQRLQAELRETDDDILRFRHRTETSELSQAVRIAQGVLESALPSLADMQRIRELHGQARSRAQEAEELDAERESQRHERLAEQAAVLERLQATVARNGPGDGVEDELQALADGVAALRAAQQQGELVPELLAAVRRGEERLEASLAARRGNARERQQARLRALSARLESLPLLPPVQESSRELSAELAAAVAASGESQLESARLEDLEKRLDRLTLALQDAYRERLALLRAEALGLDESGLVEEIEASASEIARGAFPRLHDIESRLRMATERRRHDEQAEIRVLEMEAARFEGLEMAGFEELRRLLEQARQQPTGSRSAALLGRAWLQLEALRSTVEQRLAGVEARLDSALVTLRQVEKLNSEDVEAARRILQHLDDQRDAFARVSLGMRLELEGSLQHAETLLARLWQQYEATRVIADQLVSGNFIDDMLGLLGGEPSRPATASGEVSIPEAESPPALVEARSENRRLNAWVDRYLALDGVRAAALVDGNGRLVAGRFRGSPAEAHERLEQWMRELGALGRELGSSGPRIATIESGGLALIATRPLGGYRMIAVVDASAAMSGMLHQLRAELAGPSDTR